MLWAYILDVADTRHPFLIPKQTFGLVDYLEENSTKQ